MMLFRGNRPSVRDTKPRAYCLPRCGKGGFGRSGRKLLLTMRRSLCHSLLRSQVVIQVEARHSIKRQLYSVGYSQLVEDPEQVVLYRVLAEA